VDESDRFAGVLTADARRVRRSAVESVLNDEVGRNYALL
jgi:hypothetical protein